MLKEKRKEKKRKIAQKWKNTIKMNEKEMK